MEAYFDFWVRDAYHIVSRYFIFAGSAFFLFYVLLKRPLWFRKIQKRLPKITDYGRDIIYSLISVSIFATVALFVIKICWDYTNFYRDIEEYGTAYYIFTFVWMFLLHDAYFYWMHRLMHQPFLFKYIHLIHHKSTNPSPWTAYAFHPLEAVVEVGIVPLIAFTLPVHMSAFGFFFLFQIIYNVYGHLGFELYPKNFHKTWIGRWVNTSVAHNLHHKKFKGNYGLYLLFWDRMMGTLRTEYDDVFDTATQRDTKHATEKLAKPISS